MVSACLFMLRSAPVLQNDINFYLNFLVVLLGLHLLYVNPQAMWILLYRSERGRFTFITFQNYGPVVTKPIEVMLFSLIGNPL